MSLTHTQAARIRKHVRDAEIILPTPALGVTPTWTPDPEFVDPNPPREGYDLITGEYLWMDSTACR